MADLVHIDLSIACVEQLTFTPGYDPLQLDLCTSQGVGLGYNSAHRRLSGRRRDQIRNWVRLRYACLVDMLARKPDGLRL